jgi:hypothetical protein
MEIKDIIRKLKELDLSKYPKEEIENLIKEVGKMGFILVTFHKGKSVMRARPNYNGERFSKKSDFSFKPQEFNKTYQRASTPNQTMFYATTVPDKLEPGELDNTRIIGVAETIPMLRDKTKSGYQKISFGRWYVKEDIDLIAIIHKDTYLKESSYTQELVSAYHEFIKGVPKEIVDRSLEFQTFLADEFAKENINEDFDYIISAVFSEMATKNRVDGIIYPSVRVGGKGFNIAITPKATEKLGLYVAGECSIYKLKDHTVVGNDAIIELDGNQDSFELVDIETHEKECLMQLGVKSIDELKDE